MPTYHYVQNQGKLMMQSREKWPETSIWAIFGQVFKEFDQIKQMNISKSIILLKNPAVSLFCLYSHPNSCKKSEKSLESFLRKLRYQPTNQPNINVSDFGLIWRRFHKYLQIKNFFQKSGSVTFLPL